MSITRLQSGLPQSFPRPVPANDRHRQRRRGPHPGYTRSRYLARPRQATGANPRLFRIT